MVQPAGKRSSYQGACLPAGQRDFRCLLRGSQAGNKKQQSSYYRPETGRSTPIFDFVNFSTLSTKPSA